MRYLSTFTGIGGFEIGIQRAFDSWETETGQAQQYRHPQRPGHNDDFGQHHVQASEICVGYSEVDQYAIKTYEEHYEHHNFGDITAVEPAGLPDFDLIVGGFPCQAFSVAGKRRGFDEARGTLFFDVARILADKRPGHLVLENVKGLLNHDGGKTFAVILGILTDLGYRVEWQVLNSKHYGVPQNRERVYIVGHLGNGCRRQIFPFTGENSNNNGGYGGQGARLTPVNNPKLARQVIYDSNGISPTLMTGSGGGIGRQSPVVQIKQPFVAMTETRTDESKAIRRESRKQGRDFSPRRGKVLVPRNDSVMNTVTANQGKEHFVTDTTRIRRLTPVECERLQGFPDNWTIGSDTQRYKQCGNAVSVPVVEAVMQALKPCLT